MRGARRIGTKFPAAAASLAAALAMSAGFALLPPARGGELARVAPIAPEGQPAAPGKAPEPAIPEEPRELRDVRRALAADGSLAAPSADAASAQRLADLASRATGDDAGAAKAAIAQLRQAGPAGLAALLEANADEVSRHRSGRGAGAAAAPGADDWPRVSAAIDAVAAQKDAYASGLYWYTDLEAAERAAKASGKPILSLRLLGRLDSEYSCANSRFFRTVLYANRDVSKALADQFVLHWKSVRPVPKITIDFGDGRVVERTITGNSIHYVLDADGNVIDAVPGLYGPRAFLRQVSEAAAMAKKVEAMDGGQRKSALRGWHRTRAAEELQQWRDDLRTAGVLVAESTTVQPAAIPAGAGPNAALNGPANPPPAIAAAPRALAKSIVERPMVVALAPLGAKAGAATPTAAGAAGAAAPPPARAAAPLATAKFMAERPMVLALAKPSAADPSALQAATDDAAWAKVAALHAEDAKLDEGSRALMAAKDPDALQAGRLTHAKRKVEDPLVKLVRNFERSVAEDTVRNEYTFHRQIHQWLADGRTGDGKSIADVDQLNEQVYAQLFLTPSSDPWLGLVPPDTYTALPNEGVCRK